MSKKNKTSKIDYDFIEIGTAFFDTLIEKATDERGLSVEPISEYLDKLPNKPNVTKINGAVVADEDEKGLDVFYVEEADIDRYNLGVWMKGCNSVGKPHDFHTRGHGIITQTVHLSLHKI
jgi:hypothetical protein